MNNHRFSIGTQYLSHGKSPRLCTVIDLMTTTNHKGDVVKAFYISSHEFMGQTIINHDVNDTNIARGIDRLKKSK